MIELVERTMGDLDTRARCGHVCRRLLQPLVVALICGATAPVLASNSPAVGQPLERRVQNGAPLAIVARVIELKETGQLHLTNGYETTLVGRGGANGTYNCSIVVHLTLVSAHRLTTTFTVSPKGGTISGKGSARYAEENGNGYFGGTIALTRGTGSYARASGNEIGISGKINRESLRLTVHVHGAMRT
jgi:hypothetical protein